MYTVNIYNCYYILITPPLYHCCHSPPIFPNFCHLSSIHSCLLSPFSCSISVSFCSAFPTPGPFFQFLTISSSSCTLSLYTVPSPLFQIWPAPLLPLRAPISQLLVLFSQFIFPSSFHFPCLSVPSGPLLFTFQFLLLFVQELMSFLLSRSCLLFSVPISFAHFPFPLLHLLSSYHPSLFPNSLPLPSSSSWCSVSSLFVLDVTSFFVHWDEIMRVVKPLGHCWSKLLKL